MTGTGTDIGFIGLGNMGGPMAANLIKAGHRVTGFDLSATSLDAFKSAGGCPAASVQEAVKGAKAVVTMLPAGKHLRAVYLGEDGVLSALTEPTLLVDCSTVDVESARAVAAAAAERNHAMIDAPVSGGVGGAEAGALTFMVGGEEEALDCARPLLEAMGKTIVHAGGAGNGQAAKICNNMVLGISMIAVSEAFTLAEKLGLSHQALFDISSKASGQCWSLTTYCPVPGPVPTSPANRDYQPGFTAAMMLKDLKLAQEASAGVGATTPLGAEAGQVYQLFCNAGNEEVDFSGVIKMLRGENG
ncbi:MAG: 3-hydroxyisobutyrate dehydrogenase [Alphaproteobacteria bacterium]|nr:3-hydroxyisobutyrate dehydrogenase [Alphaproteobacteria bacterium]